MSNNLLFFPGQRVMAEVEETEGFSFVWKDGDGEESPAVVEEVPKLVLRDFKTLKGVVKDPNTSEKDLLEAVSEARKLLSTGLNIIELVD
jgi:hypothetical protein